MVIRINPGRPVVIVGNNNQGKTNFLESIGVLISGRSPLSAPLQDTIGGGASITTVGGDIQIPDKNARLYVRINSDGKKVMSFDGKSPGKFSDILKWVNYTYWSADAIQLFSGSGDMRRSLLNNAVRHCIVGGKSRLALYDKIILQKNRLLKQPNCAQILSVLNSQLIELAPQVVADRLVIIGRIIDSIRRLLNEIGLDHMSDFDIRYRTISENSTVLADKIKAESPRELMVGYSLFGPHRDDFSIYIAGESLFDRLSRGMNRIVALLFRLVVLELIKMPTETVSRPMLLLDDGLCELDRHNKQILINLFERRTQLVYTTVLEDDFNLFSVPIDRYTMVSGRLT